MTALLSTELFIHLIEFVSALSPKSCILKPVSSTKDWAEYHRIRRSILFTDREYDENHADEFLPSNTPLILVLGNTVIGTVRLDIRDKTSVIIRLVAIDREYQGKGFGKILHSLVIDKAKKQGANIAYVNAKLDAIGFYKRLGWEPYEWDKTELRDIAIDCLQMRLIFSH